MSDKLEILLGLLVLAVWSFIPLKALTVGGVPWGVMAIWGAVTAAVAIWARWG